MKMHFRGGCKEVTFLTFQVMGRRRFLCVAGFLVSLVILHRYVEYGNGYVPPSSISFQESRSLLFSSVSPSSISIGEAQIEVLSDVSIISEVFSNDSAVLNSSRVVDFEGSEKPSVTEPEQLIIETSFNVERDSPLEEELRSNEDVTDQGITNSTMQQELPTNSLLNVHNLTMNKTTDNVVAGAQNWSSISAVASAPPPIRKRKWNMPPFRVLSLFEMSDKMQRGYRSLKPKWHSQANRELRDAKSLIQSAETTRSNRRIDATVYRNYSAFMRSYELMEQTLKIYIYSEGAKPVFHQQVLGGIYASEGWFMKLLEENKQFVTKNAEEAHLFYLPFSSLLLQRALYVKNSHSRVNMVEHLSRYLETIAAKYPYWNRTLGADHFLVACHDWAQAETSRIMKNCIRSLCNAEALKGFKFGKDVSLPETYVRHPKYPLQSLGGKPPNKRPFLVFFAGSMHGYLRPILLKHWENKDPDMKITGALLTNKGEMSYKVYMKSSKYCISARGYEAFSPRVVEAIFYECVPVIIADNYVPPFFETLNWESFAVFIAEKDIPNLKKILLSIPEKQYIQMQQRVKMVQKHFLWHRKPVKQDIFHMILHSVWLTRVSQM